MRWYLICSDTVTFKKLSDFNEFWKFTHFSKVPPVWSLRKCGLGPGSWRDPHVTLGKYLRSYSAVFAYIPTYNIYLEGSTVHLSQKRWLYFVRQQILTWLPFQSDKPRSCLSNNFLRLALVWRIHLWWKKWRSQETQYLTYIAVQRERK